MPIFFFKECVISWLLTGDFFYFIGHMKCVAFLHFKIFSSSCQYGSVCVCVCVFLYVYYYYLIYIIYI